MNFIGQHHIMNVLAIMLPELMKNPTEGASLLFDGPSGYGKTTLALSLCDYFTEYAGRGFEYYLYDSKPFVFRSRVIFVDEIHRIKDFEILFPHLDRKNKIFIFATNHSGNLPEALLTRCDHFVFTEYDNEELMLMAIEAAKFRTSDANFLKLIIAANRNPRVLKSLVDNFGRYFNQFPEVNPVTADFDEILATVFQIFDGMDTLARRYIEVLETIGGRASLTLLSNILHIDAETLRTSVEPNLLKSGRIQISSKGRQIV